MNLRKWVQQTTEYGYSSVAGGLGIAGAGVGYVTELVGSLRLFGSTTISDSNQKFDERHYLLVPDTAKTKGAAPPLPRSGSNASIAANSASSNRGAE